jgi:hypothetical protein
MNRSISLLLLTLALAAGGCSKPLPVEQATTFPEPPGLTGVYDGSFPCDNCKEIAATLWLRDDGRFFFRQNIVLETGKKDTSSYSFGLWTWDENSAEIVLAGRGPDRRLGQLDAERLQLRTASAIEHVLARNASAPPFEDRVQLEGESAVAENGAATFTQCVTGLQFPIAEVAAYKELRRQHRALNRVRKVALTTVEAHFKKVTANQSTREWLVVDKVVGNIKPGTACEGTAPPLTTQSDDPALRSVTVAGSDSGVESPK